MRAIGGRIAWLFAGALLTGAAQPPLASAADAERGRGLYAGICARCHSDPPGSGAIDPRVRTGDEIRAAINRVSPMRPLGDQLSAADLADIAAYFQTVLGPPTNAPDYDVSGQWASVAEPWWALYVTHYASRTQLLGGWLTFDERSNPTWLFFHEFGSWTAPGVYTAKLLRNSGPPFSTPPGVGAPPSTYTEVGTIAFVFTDRDNAEVTFVMDGIRIAHKVRRVVVPR